MKSEFKKSDQDKLEQKLIANVDPQDISIRYKIKPGDVGYIIYMHGFIYSQEYNYTTAFEGYVAKSFYDFLINYDENKDRLWVAEHNGQIVGSVGIVGHGERAQFRWFLIHPDYRGFKLGSRLLNEAIEYCKLKGYKVIFLQTTDDLDRAIDMYKRAGFVKTKEKENYTWSDNLLELEFELTIESSS